jgi:hypothetical protein
MTVVRWVAAALLLASCSGNPAPRPAAPAAAAEGATRNNGTAAPDDPARGASTITPDDYYRRIAFLASDSLEGRDTPSRGLDKAAAYIAEQFRSFGLSPAGDSGTFLQHWPYTQATLDAAKTFLRAESSAGVVSARVVQDFFVAPAAAGPSATGGVTWVGVAKPGATAPAPARDKRFLVWYAPGAAANAEWSGAVSAVVQTVDPQTVAGIVLVLDPAFDAAMIGQIAHQLAEQPGGPSFIIGLRYSVARDMFRNAGQDLDALRAATGGAPVDLPGTTLNVTVSRNITAAQAPNVVAMLLGSDPVLRDQFVVFSAHMDHVGIGAPDAQGDSIFNGADDDASGTASVLEVAQAFASMPVRPKRSLLFLTVSGEEKGLLGSGHFVQHPPVPLAKLVADINLDMVGRNAPDTVVAIGQDYSSLGLAAQEIARRHPELGLVVAPDLWPSEQLFFRSDHFNFAKSGVPAIFFTTGLHEQYHKPSDEVDLIDRDKISRIGRLVFYLAWDVANAAQPPSWTEKGITEVKPNRR